MNSSTAANSSVASPRQDELQHLLSLLNAEQRAHYQAAVERQAQLTKPAGSLGRLEDLAVFLSAFQGGKLALGPAQAVHFAADHPVVAQGIAPYPQEVTRAMVKNFLHGGAASSVLCRQLNIPLTVVDVGVAGGGVEAPQNKVPGFELKRAEMAGLAAGDISHEDAMSTEVFQKAVEVGRATVRALPSDTKVLILGEMGIGNTTVASCVAAALLDCADPAEFVGAGTGAVGPILEKKREVVRSAVARLQGKIEPEEVLRRVGGRELAALYGAFREAYQRGIIVLVDGFIVTAAALAAVRAQPELRLGLVFSHCSAERGHQRLLEALHAAPLLSLELRLGEGSGALTAYPLLLAAAAIHQQMATFAEAEVPEGDSKH